MVEGGDWVVGLTVVLMLQVAVLGEPMIPNPLT